jgi:hypothetical protein
MGWRTKIQLRDQRAIRGARADDDPDADERLGGAAERLLFGSSIVKRRRLALQELTSSRSRLAS